MSATLGDILLVMLGDRPASAYELRQRHAEALGAAHRLDVRRVEVALVRLQRVGHVYTDQVLSHGAKRVWSITEAGRHRQRSWIVDVGPEEAVEDLVARVLIALAATDRATFEAVVESCLTRFEGRRPRVARRAGVTTPAEARSAFDTEVAKATLRWLQQLRTHDRVA
ncbi:DNA-binding PadR family transcriptional regulator [Actinoplanes tereljensis]|uniref:PadR family transcriptional regulator n=1 Tax=Paractinoplanes tereljensis TaxID=571912 RepID=A0A919NRQ6_9ACTN|nr:PadR family transcriptional regulator [Actinoplanes tereljensis]GIF23483.1 hypothetical protein Ate02nite_62130 [Actinoplanes tereljensis]